MISNCFHQVYPVMNNVVLIGPKCHLEDSILKDDSASISTDGPLKIFIKDNSVSKKKKN